MILGDEGTLKTVCRSAQERGAVLVVTSGSFDLFHIGHAQYLAKARQQGTHLLVGVDSDARVRERKGEHRPIVPEMERALLVSMLRSVDYVFVKPPGFAIHKVVRPDILVVTEGTDVSKYDMWTKVVTLPRQAETSTSNLVRKAAIAEAAKVPGNAKEQVWH